MQTTRAILTLLLLATGCSHWVEIKPTELPKLNGGAVAAGTIASGTERGEIVAVSVAHVEKPDGTLTEIEGEFDVRITSTSDNELTFDHPVYSALVDGALTVQGENRAKTSFRLDEVRAAAVSQPDTAATALLAVGFFVVCVGAPVLAVVASQ